MRFCACHVYLPRTYPPLCARHIISPRQVVCGLWHPSQMRHSCGALYDNDSNHWTLNSAAIKTTEYSRPRLDAHDSSGHHALQAPTSTGTCSRHCDLGHIASHGIAPMIMCTNNEDCAILKYIRYACTCPHAVLRCMLHLQNTARGQTQVSDLLAFMNAIMHCTNSKILWQQKTAKTTPCNYITPMQANGGQSCDITRFT